MTYDARSLNTSDLEFLSYFLASVAEKKQVGEKKYQKLMTAFHFYEDACKLFGKIETINNIAEPITVGDDFQKRTRNKVKKLKEDASSTLEHLLSVREKALDTLEKRLELVLKFVGLFESEKKERQTISKKLKVAERQLEAWRFFGALQQDKNVTTVRIIDNDLKIVYIKNGVQLEQSF